MFLLVYLLVIHPGFRSGPRLGGSKRGVLVKGGGLYISEQRSFGFRTNKLVSVFWLFCSLVSFICMWVLLLCLLCLYVPTFVGYPAPGPCCFVCLGLMFVCLSVCLSVCMYVCYVCMVLCACMYVCVTLAMYVSYVCMLIVWYVRMDVGIQRLSVCM